MMQYIDFRGRKDCVASIDEGDAQLEYGTVDFRSQNGTWAKHGLDVGVRTE